MGLLTSIGEKFSNTIKSSVASMAETMAELSNSFVYSGGAILNTGLNSNGLGQFNTLPDTSYFAYLRPYHFISALVDILTSCLRDAIVKSDFHCSIVNDEEHTKRANDLIDTLQLKQFVLDNLPDIVYRGVYAFGVDYRKKKLYALTDPYDCKVITNTRDIIGYEIGGKLLSNNNLAAYYYSLRFDESIETKDDREDKGYVLDESDDIPEELKGIVVKYKKYNPIGLFNGKLFRIFQMYSLESALYYLGLRESMKPTLLAMSTGGRQIDVDEAINMANKVEFLLNEPVTNLSQLADPVVYMNQLIWAMLNNVKVVPSIEQYNNISDINAGDLATKREKLAQELENIKKETLSELTIPEEIFGGNGNRWEQYSRSDRFMTTIDTYLEGISRMCKQIVSKYTGISTVSISFSIDTSSLTVSFDTKNKIALISEKLADISRLIGAFSDILDNEFVVKDKAYPYLRDQVKAIDSKLGDILIADIVQEGEGDEDSSGMDEDYEE